MTLLSLLENFVRTGVTDNGWDIHTIKPGLTLRYQCNEDGFEYLDPEDMDIIYVSKDGNVILDNDRHLISYDDITIVDLSVQ